MDSKGWWVKILPKIADVKLADMDDFFFSKTQKKKFWQKVGFLKSIRIIKFNYFWTICDKVCPEVMTTATHKSVNKSSHSVRTVLRGALGTISMGRNNF